MAIPACNAFVVLPPLTRNGSVIFGKNSNRPQGEVQELIYEPPRQYAAGESVKCTYIEVSQVENTYGVILSKPAWMWGCEMGANDQGVVVCNLAISTKVKSPADHDGLLGTDLVRLALERSNSSEEGVDVITKLISEHGIGGCYSDSAEDLYYQTSFLLADGTEAWVLETAGTHWVAEKVKTKVRSIYSSPTIGSNFDKSSPKITNFAKDNGFWDGEGEFNFAEIFCDNDAESGNNCSKYLKGQELLKQHGDNNFSVKSMFEILRQSEFYNEAGKSFPTAASQVSSLSNNKPCCHWFTSTPDPVLSVFKPFIFTPDVKISLHTKSPVPDDLTNIEKPIDRRHNLYKLHANICSNTNSKVITLLHEMEQDCLEEMEIFIEEFQKGQSLSEVDELLKDIVETEVKFYK